MKLTEKKRELKAMSCGTTAEAERVQLDSMRRKEKWLKKVFKEEKLNMFQMWGKLQIHRHKTCSKLKKKNEASRKLYQGTS